MGTFFNGKTPFCYGFGGVWGEIPDFLREKSEFAHVFCREKGPLLLTGMGLDRYNTKKKERKALCSWTSI